MSTFAQFLHNVLTRVKQNSSLKLHFFVSTELGEYIRDKRLRLTEGILLETGCLTLHICLLHRGTSAVHLDNGKGYVSEFGEITFCEYNLKSNVCKQKRRKSGMIVSSNI